MTPTWTAQLVKQVNVSSTGHYSFFAYVSDGRRRAKRMIEPNGEIWALAPRMGYIKAPVYVKRDLQGQLLAALESGAMRFYEYDRDENPRYSNLRYYDERDIACLIRRLKEWAQGYEQEAK